MASTSAIAVCPDWLKCPAMRYAYHGQHCQIIIPPQLDMEISSGNQAHGNRPGRYRQTKAGDAQKKILATGVVTSIVCGLPIGAHGCQMWGTLTMKRGNLASFRIASIVCSHSQPEVVPGRRSEGDIHIHSQSRRARSFPCLSVATGLFRLFPVS